MTAAGLNFCSECGVALDDAEAVPGHRRRCRNGHLNTPAGPKILVACFINCGPRLLWMRRANQPRAGFWAIPAGFMESGETLREAAARELREETCVDIDPERLTPYMIGSISYISEVYVSFRATVDSTDCGCGMESTEVGFFSRDELDWDNVAYPSANEAVLQAYSEAEQNRFGIYHGIFTEAANCIEEVAAPPGKRR